MKEDAQFCQKWLKLEDFVKPKGIILLNKKCLCVARRFDDPPPPPPQAAALWRQNLTTVNMADSLLTCGLSPAAAQPGWDEDLPSDGRVCVSICKRQKKKDGRCLRLR